MAIRMQQRRGTAAQWISLNDGDGPILGAGEIGFESDTGKFKIGDGTNHWVDLAYFVDIDKMIEGAPGLLDTINELAAAINDDPAFFTTVSTALGTKAPIASPTFTGTVTLPSGTVTSTMIADGTIATADIADSAVTSAKIANDTIVDADINSAAAIAQSKISGLTTDLSAKAPLASPTFTGTVSGVTKTHVGLGNVDNTSDANKPVSTATQTALDAKLASATAATTYAPLAAPAFTGTATAVNLTISGDLTVNGTTTTVNSNAINVNNQIIFEGATSDAFETTLTVVDPTADRTITFPDTTGTVALTSDVTTHGNLTEAHGATGAVVGTTNTQTLTNKTLTSPAINTPTGITKSDVGLANVDNTTDANKPVSTATQTALDLKAPLASPTFTGTVTLPSGTVTSTMIADGTIADADINASAAIALSKLATDPLARANHTGSQAASTISDFNEAAQDAVGNSVTNGITYTDSTGALGLNYVTVGNTLLDGVSGASYGLIGTSTYLDVKDTNGYNKEIELDIAAVETKLNTDGYLTTSSTSTLTNKTLTSPKINEDVAVTATATELNYVDGVTSAIQTQLDAKAPLAAPAFTGTATAVNLTISGDLTVNGTTTNLNSTSLVIEDKNVVLGDTATPTDTTADGGGITLKGTTDKTFNWVDATDAWTSSEDMNLLTGKVYKINGTTVLSGSTLGSGVTGSSLTSVGTITSGTWTGTTIAIANGGTGATTASTAAAALLPSQTSNSGKYLTTDGSGTLSWGTVSGYSAPTLGSTSIASGATVTTIAGLTSVTSTGFTGALTGNASTATTLQTARAINGTNFDGSAAITITAANPNALTIGTGLSGSSYTGSGAVTIAIDSTVATLTGTQTLTNKTLTSPTINSATSNNITLTGTVTAGGSAGTSGYVLQSTGSGVQWAASSGGGGADEQLVVMGAY